jgi:hypothetical protein
VKIESDDRSEFAYDLWLRGFGVWQVLERISQPLPPSGPKKPLCTVLSENGNAVYNTGFAGLSMKSGRLSVYRLDSRVGAKLQTFHFGVRHAFPARIARIKS